MARRQEQEEAREDVVEVAPGVARMQLPIRMPGLGHVNCYALIDNEGAAVVDPGLPGTASWKALQARLARVDLAMKDVHTVVITHSHPDHFGGAARLAKESGAKIVAHRSFGHGMWIEAPDPEVSVEDLEAQRDAGNGPSAPEDGETRSADRPSYHSLSARGRRGYRTPWGDDRRGRRAGSGSAGASTASAPAA